MKIGFFRGTIIVIFVLAIIGEYSGDGSDPDSGAVMPIVPPGPPEIKPAPSEVAANAATTPIPPSVSTFPFTNVCERDPGVTYYCDDVGKRAHNFLGHKALRNIDLGPIIGVSWRPQGSLVSDRGQDIRVSPRNAFYYIVGPGGVADYNFLRMAREITPR